MNKSLVLAVPALLGLAACVGHSEPVEPVTADVAAPIELRDLSGRTVAADRLVEALDGGRSPRATAVAAQVVAPRRPIMDVLDDDVQLA